MGDKGSYLYASFGAPVAHEDNAVRVAAALDLRAKATSFEGIDEVQIGLSGHDVDRRLQRHGASYLRRHGQ